MGQIGNGKWPEGSGTDRLCRGRCDHYATHRLPACGDIEANLGVTASAATLALVVPPFIFQFVQQPLFVQF